MSNVNLMAHCGANYVDRLDLGKPKLPAATDSYTPIGHDYFVDLVEDRLNDKGLKIVNSGFALGNDGANMFGVLEVGHAKNDDYATVVGLRNSHIKWFAASLACGSGVFVCDNLAFSGEVTVGRKHTSMILEDLPTVIDEAVGQVIDLKSIMDKRYEAYKARQFAQWEADHVIMNMLRQGVINTGRVEKVVAEWDAPSHKSFQKTGDSAWRLFNATTEALKGLSMNELAPRTQKLHTLIDQVAEIDLAA